MSKSRVAPKARSPKVHPLTDEQLRLNLDGRQRVVDELAGRMRGLHPAFGRRPMTYDDAVRAVLEAGLTIDVAGSNLTLADAYLAQRDRAPVIVVRPGLLEPYLVYAVFYVLAQHVDAGATWRSHGAALDSASLAYLALVGEPAGPPYPIVTDIDMREQDGQKTLDLTARHAIRRRGEALAWEPRALTLRRYVEVPDDQARVRWTDEDVLRVIRSAIFTHDVRQGRAKIGEHHRTLKDFAPALARFGSAVAGGVREIRRRGHRDVLKIAAYMHAVRAR